MENPAAVLKLQYPFQWGKDRLVDTLEFRRVKAKDLKNLPENEGSQLILLVARLTNEPPSLIDEVDGVDIRAAGEIVKGFTQSSPQTGEPSSDGPPTD